MGVQGWVGSLWPRNRYYGIREADRETDEPGNGIMTDAVINRKGIFKMQCWGISGQGWTCLKQVPKGRLL